jgi:hypothetical protein
MASPKKKSRKSTSKSDKSEDVDFAASDGASPSSSDGSDYAEPESLVEDLMGLNLPLHLPNDSTPRKVTKESDVSQPSTSVQPPMRVFDHPHAVTLSGPNGPQPAFMFPSPPYPPFPLGYPNTGQSSTSRQPAPIPSFKKRPSDSSENQVLDTLSRQVDDQSKPLKKARKEGNETRVQTERLPFASSLHDRTGVVSDKTEQAIKRPDVSTQVSKTVSAPEDCSACGRSHEDGTCLLDEEKQMMEYRTMILSEAGDETLEERVRIQRFS